MKLTPVTLRLLAGVAAISNVVAADTEKDAPAAVDKKKPTKDERAEAKLLFAVADKNADGVISKKEFEAAFAQLKQVIITKHQLQAKFPADVANCPWCGSG